MSLAVALLAAMIAPYVHAQSPEAKPLTLVAAASDANAAVFDDGAALRKVAVGERLPGLPWTLAAVRDARAVLDAERRLGGQRLVLELAVGDRVDAAALAALEAAHAPQPTPELTIKAVPRGGVHRPVKAGTP